MSASSKLGEWFAVDSAEGTGEDGDEEDGDGDEVRQQQRHQDGDEPL